MINRQEAGQRGVGAGVLCARKEKTLRGRRNTIRGRLEERTDQLPRIDFKERQELAEEQIEMGREL